MPYADRQKQLEHQRAWSRRNYQANKAQERARISARKKAIGAWLSNYKATLSCMRCGESEAVCLDFHHLQPEKKDFNLGYVKVWGWGRERIMREIEKCVVLCANCHRKEHFKK